MRNYVFWAGTLVALTGAQPWPAISTTFRKGRRPEIGAEMRRETIRM